jgi:hypothetical protein
LLDSSSYALEAEALDVPVKASPGYILGECRRFGGGNEEREIVTLLKGAIFDGGLFNASEWRLPPFPAAKDHNDSRLFRKNLVELFLPIAADQAFLCARVDKDTATILEKVSQLLCDLFV